jgi:uncharacterized DUF497 family protein
MAIRQEFEWDENKAIANLSKHKISFDEASTVFNDPFAITILDPDQAVGEDRCLTLGESIGKLLVVSHTTRKGKIRIISCLKATARERKKYEEG